jgi:ATP-dependent Clp protease adaptor protein ClpS
VTVINNERIMSQFETFEDQGSASAVLVRPKAAPPIQDPDLTTRRPGYEQYAIVMYNDNDHTFEYVIALLRAVFHYPTQQCIELASNIHRRGRAIVWTGMLEPAELKVQQIRKAPRDDTGPRPVNYPLQVEIQPLS